MDHRADALPAQIGRYQIRSLIGRGGMGEVYGAYDPSLDRHVALKTIVAGSDNPSLVERLQREARACGRLHHPGIVTIHDLGEAEGTVFIAMEWLQGQSLADAMNGGTLTFTAKLRILSEILDALAYAHGEGIIHRDIKPSNVWVQPSGQAKLLDFGLARLAHVDALTLPGEVMGTPYYMSPEQLKGHTVDGRTDVFSTGVLGYELLAHRRAFDGESITAIIIKVLGETPPPIGTAWTAAFPEVDSIIGRAMAKSPDDRYPTAQAFAVALREFMTAHSADIPRVAEAVTRESSQAVIEAQTLLAQGLSEQATERLTVALARDPEAATIRNMLSGPTVIISQRPPSAAPASAAATAPLAPPVVASRAAMTPPHIIAIPKGPAAPLFLPEPASLAATTRHPVAPATEVRPASPAARMAEPAAPTRARGWIWMVAALLLVGVGVTAYFTWQPGTSSVDASGPGSSGGGAATPGTSASSVSPPTSVPPTTSPDPISSDPGRAVASNSPIPAPAPTGGGGAVAAGTTAAAPVVPVQGRPQPPGPGGRRGAGPALATLAGLGISEASTPPLRGPMAARLFDVEGLPRPARPGEARWVLTLTGDIAVRPSPLGGSGWTADYTGEAQILDRVLRRTDSKQFEGHALEFAQNIVRRKATQELTDKMADYIIGIIRSR